MKINFLKEIRSKIKNNDIDFIVTNINSRLVYWILKKRICEIDNFNAGNCGISEKFLIILISKDDYKTIKNLDIQIKQKVYFLND